MIKIPPRNGARIKPTSARVYRDSKGAATVEFALVLPIIILILFSIFEFSRGLMTYQLIANASRIGARTGVVDLDEAANSANQYLQRFGLDSAAVQVTEESNPSTVRVDVSIGCDEVAIVAPIFLKNATISSSTVMAKEEE